MYIGLNNINKTVAVKDLEDFFKAKDISIKNPPSDGFVIIFKGWDEKDQFAIFSKDNVYTMPQNMKDFMIIKNLIGSEEFNKKFKFKSVELIAEDELIIAVLDFNLKKINELLESGMNINYQNSFGNTALMQFIINCGETESEKNLEVIQLLIDKGIDLTIKNNTNYNAYQIAVMVKNKEIASLLQDAMGSKLIDAIIAKNIETANELIQSGANVGYQDSIKRTALFYSILDASIPDDLIKLLLKHATSDQLNIQDKDKSTVLMHAVYHNKSINIIQMLIDKKPDLTLKNYLSRDAFSYAKDRGDQNIIKIFEKAFGAQLIEAAKNNDMEQARKLFDAGADINTFIAGDNVNIITGLRDDRSALFYATSFEMFELLANNNGKDLLDINVKDSENITLLMIYAFNANKQIVQYLIDKNADLAAKDDDFEYVLSYARAGLNVANTNEKQKHQEMIDLIKKTLNIQFFECVENNTFEKMIRLLNAYADINYQDSNGMTALIYASKEGFIDMVSELINRDADLKIKDNNNKSALNWAKEMKHVEIIKLLSNGNQMKIFVIISRYIVDSEIMNEARPEYLEFINQYYQKGNFIVSGGQNPLSGGVILAKAETREEIENIIKQSPFYSKNLAEFNIYEFSPNKATNETDFFEQFVSN